MYNQIDMVFDEAAEDLTLDSAGRLKYHTHDTPIQAVVRRATTPEGGYARMVRVGSTTVTLNTGYKNSLPYRLSTTDVTVDQIGEHLTDAANDDRRVFIENIQSEENALGRLVLRVDYTTVGTNSADLSNTLLTL